MYLYLGFSSSFIVEGGENAVSRGTVKHYITLEKIRKISAANTRCTDCRIINLRFLRRSSTLKKKRANVESADKYGILRSLQQRCETMHKGKRVFNRNIDASMSGISIHRCNQCIDVSTCIS